MSDEQGNFVTTKKTLQLLHNATDLLLEAYNNGHVDRNELDDKSGRLADSLQQSQILFVTNHGKMRLNPVMSRLISLVNQSEKSRYINTDFEGHYEELKITTDRYLKLRQNNGIEAQRLFGDIETIVYEVMQEVISASLRLRTRINTQFGYVRTIEDKKIENERAIEVAERLIRNIKVFTYEQLKRLAGTNTRLLNLLCRELTTTIDNCHSELQGTLSQLRALLTEYRVQQKKSTLVTGFLKYWSLYPEYTPAEHTEEAFVPDVLNTIEPLVLHSNVDLSNESLEDELLNIIDKSKAKDVVETPKQIRKEPATARAGDATLVAEVKIDELELACDKFLASVIKTGKRRSAGDFFAEEQIPYSRIVWLFVLTSKLVNLEKAHKQAIGYEFKVRQPTTIKDAGKRLLEDIECFSKI